MSQLHPTSLIDAEFARKVYRAEVPAETSAETLVTPSYWQHVATKLRRGDLIEVIATDNSWFATLVVRSARRLDATVSLVSRVQLEAPVLDKVLIDGYEIKFRGARSKWSIMNDNKVLKDGFETEGQARVYLDDHLKALAA